MWLATSDDFEVLRKTARQHSVEADCKFCVVDQIAGRMRTYPAKEFTQKTIVILGATVTDECSSNPDH
jgi:hypothetical protein